jgi:putative tricarboxylic transport membrane protein
MSQNDESQSPTSVLRAFRADQVSAAVWLTVGIVILLQSRELEYMEEYGPGPGFLPYWLGVLFVVLGIVLFAKATFFAENTEVIELPTGRGAYQLLLVIASIVGLALLTEAIGFIICIGLMFFFLLAFVERRGWKFALVMGIGSASVFWIVFEFGLDLRLPPGVLELLKGQG